MTQLNKSKSLHLNTLINFWEYYLGGPPKQTNHTKIIKLHRGKM